MEEDNRSQPPPPCPICREPLVNQPVAGSRYEPVAMQCNDLLNHVFHRECIVAWRSTPLACAKTCPVCRVDPVQRLNEQRLKQFIGRDVVAGRTSRWRPMRWWRELKEVWNYVSTEILSQRWVQISLVIGAFLALAFFYVLLAKTLETEVRWKLRVHGGEQEFVRQEYPGILELRGDKNK